MRFGEPLGPSDAKGEDAGSSDRVVDPVYRTKGPLDPLEVVRFAEPFVGVPRRSVDGDRERERRAYQ